MALTLQRYFGYTRILATGAPAPLATVTVYDPTGTLTLATIYADSSGTPKSNPFTSDASGFFFFYVPEGEYDVRFSGGGIVTPYTWGDVFVASPSPENILYISNFVSLADALTFIGSDPVTLVINQPTTMVDTTVIPSNISLIFAKPGSLALASGKTLTINGPLTAPAYPIFTGTGTVISISGVNTYLCPEWWGAVGNGTTNDSAAFAAMTTVAAATGQEMRIGAKRYYLATTWDCTALDNVRIQGEGWAHSVILSGTVATATPGIDISATLKLPSYINDLNVSSVTGTIPAYSAGNNGIQCAVPTAGDIAGLGIFRCHVAGFGDNGILISGPTGPIVIEDCYIYQCAKYGIYMGISAGNTPTQNVTIVRGAIQSIPGGIYNRGYATTITETDIELGPDGLYPAVFTDGHAVANAGSTTLIGVTTSCSTPLTPPGLITVWGNPGCVIQSCFSACADNATANVYVISDSGYPNTLVLGGVFTGSGTISSYYPFYVNTTLQAGAGMNFSVINPAVAAYQTGRDIVYSNVSGLGARITTIGIQTNALPSSGPNGIQTEDVSLARLGIVEGIATPTNVTGMAIIYSDAADVLKIRFASGTIKTFTLV